MKTYFILILISFIYGCTKQEKSEESESQENKLTAGETSVVLNHEQQREGGIKIEPVQLRKMQQTITVSGLVEFDQRRLVYLTSRVAGRVEKVFAYLGDRVSKNDLLATVYSQEYLAAQAEFIQIQSRLQKIEARGDTSDVAKEKSIFESVKQKLMVMGATTDDLREIAQIQVPKMFLEIRSPLTGTIIEANEILGHFVEIGSKLFRIADLTHVWVRVDVYEKDLQFITTGIDATVEVTAYPGEKFRGRLTRISDVVNEKTRTISARAEVENRSQKLKPQMFATTTLSPKTTSEVLTLPSSAIQRDGEERYVFIAADESTFVKRNVKVGKETQGWMEIVNGVKKGEAVVAKGAFTLKSELLKETFGEEE